MATLLLLFSLKFNPFPVFLFDNLNFLYLNTDNYPIIIYIKNKFLFIYKISFFLSFFFLIIRFYYFIEYTINLFLLKFKIISVIKSPIYDDEPGVSKAGLFNFFLLKSKFFSFNLIHFFILKKDLEKPHLKSIIIFFKNYKILLVLLILPLPLITIQIISF